MDPTQNSNGTAGSTANAGANPGAQSSPGAGGNADTISIPRSEYDKLSRYGEQVKGFQPFYERAKTFGVQRVEDFDKYEPYVKTIGELEKRGIKHDMLGRMFSGEADADLNKPEQPAFDPEKFTKEFEAKFERKHAEREWADLTKKEKQHVDAALKDIFGEDVVDDMTKAMYARAVNDFMNENREEYPKGHPLHGQFLQPFGESLRSKAVEYVKAEKAKYAGASKAAKADAAIAAEKKGAPTAAGRSGGSGAPAKKTTPSAHNPHDDAAILAAYEAKKAARAGGMRG